ncbi:unnamed protein product [Effrenium voratum]|nr:unnamed protein product [Effrenium voratum]
MKAASLAVKKKRTAKTKPDGAAAGSAGLEPMKAMKKLKKKTKTAEDSGGKAAAAPCELCDGLIPLERAFCCRKCGRSVEPGKET